ncbi:hypothetical protein DMH04_35800 [Kibdelosporangium aridum]|uniref:Uncharacterized protein n=1 Tax=Kibdelosporangium aridum TaxID=2030 RepID=A0A428YZS4_KIBAR|nr:hypothetical protein [Kibdelosporangium aridum]RSM77010.1 hypothetical protein DMH04_35800 [Kibdelosporangium aridum]
MRTQKRAAVLLAGTAAAIGLALSGTTSTVAAPSPDNMGYDSVCGDNMGYDCVRGGASTDNMGYD